MADLDPVVQEILLEGDGELITALGEIEEKGTEAFKALSEAAEGGAGSLAHFADAITGIGGAISAAITGLTAWAQAQDEATQKTAFLATAMQTTAAQVNGLEDAFAAAGVSAGTAERLLQRLTTTIAQQWPAITASVRTAATQQSEAQEAIIASTLRVNEAQRAVQEGAAEDSQKAEADALRVSAAYRALQTAATDAASARVHASQNVESANNSLESAEARLRTLEGNPPSAAEKLSLDLKNAELAVDEARQRQVDALAAKQKQAAEEADQAAQKQLALAQAVQAAEKDAEGRTDAQRARENSLAEAIDHRAAAQERADQQALTSIPRITSALQGVVDKNSAMAKSIDLNGVSVQNLTKGILNLAAQENNVSKPTGLQAFNELVKVISSSTDELISKDQQLAIVQSLVSRGMGVGAIAASDLLAAIQHGPAYFKAYTDAARDHISTQKEGIEAAEEFKKSLESFDQALTLTNRDLAALASPQLSAFFDAMKESINSTSGTLHLLVDGIKAIGGAIGSLITAFQSLGAQLDKSLNLEKGRSLQIVILALVSAVGFFASAWLAVPAAVAVVITVLGFITDHMKEINEWIDKNRATFVAWAAAVGVIVGLLAPIPLAIAAITYAIVSVYENWDKVKAKLTDNAVTQFFSNLLDIIVKIGQALGLLKPPPTNSAAANNPAPGAEGPSAPSTTGAEAPISRAGGGAVNGPGSHTSDSILARLSDGEFVQKAAAVQHYGVDFMHAINNMSFPGFAAGGLVASPVRMTGGGSSIPASSTLNLSIDGKAFNGLRGPKTTVDDLASYAIARQTGSGGKRPSWQG